MILVGLWFHESKPSFNTYMVPIAHRLRKLYDEGLEVTLAREVDDKGNPFYFVGEPNVAKKKIKAVLITGTLDNPARDLALNKCGHGAQEGCFCKEKGEADFR